MNKKVLVLGGTGFLGNRLKTIKPEWIYIGSRDCDLTNSKQCGILIKDTSPDAIVHIAARVGGIKDNAERQAEFYYDNVMINTNVINEAKKAGVPRVLSSLSTCCFPNVVDSYPFSESAVLSGPPAPTNLSYGFAKRALFVQTVAYRKQYGVNYSCFSPSNLYGPEDHFNNQKSHFVAAMIKKMFEASDGDNIEFWGTGSPLRQQLYVDDLAEIIPALLDKHNTDQPVIVAPNENLSIREMVEICIDISGKQIKPFFNGNLDGQYRKDGSNKKLLETIGNFEFTKFRDGLKKTYEWYSNCQELNDIVK